MINLLSADTQTMYRYARRNSQLVRWIIACSFGFVGLAAISIAGIVYIQQTTSSYDTQINAAQQSLTTQKQAETEREAKAISGNIKLAVQVLSKEILFSDLLKQIARITPNDASLTNLNISQVKGALDITADAATYDAATQLQVNLADPRNKIFSQADIVSINCTNKAAAADAVNKYPCSVSIRALFAADNPYLFTAKKAAGQ